MVCPEGASGRVRQSSGLMLSKIEGKKPSSLTGMRSGYLSLILLDSAWRFSVGESGVEEREREKNGEKKER